MLRTFVALALLVVCLAPAVAPAAEKRAMTLDDLFAFKRVSDPQISPDGKLVAYVVTSVDLAGNKTSSAVWLAPADGKGEPRLFVNSGKKDRHPRWSPDGKRILFESTRSGDGQLWVIDLDGGEARQFTTISTGAGSARWSPDGKLIAFVSAVYPEFSDKPYAESNAANKKKSDELEQSPVKAKTFTKLFYRHWDSYVEDKRQHLFVMPAAGGEPKDVTPGDRDAYPTSSTFETGDNYTFSPDSSHLVFTAVPPRDEAWSTNYEICRVPVTGGTKDWETLTKDNKAADSGPVFSPDGKKLAYRSQKKAGYEADKWELLVVDCKPDGAFAGKPLPLLAQMDVSASEFVWYRSEEVLFAVERNGNTLLQRIPVDGGSGQILISVDGTSGSLSAAVHSDPPLVALTYARMNQPPEVMAGWPAHKPGSLKMISHANDALHAAIDLPPPESVKVQGAGGTPMQMWILKPPGFDAKKKWPVAYLVHGGPQGAWEDGWSFRWCPELWAAQGYVVAMPNPRGSTGFGQKYVDEISGDWGGKCYDDLMAGVDYLEKLPYVDKDRIAAAGASFGGYMMNWFAVNTGRFKTLITHCSVWNFESMWGTTDELWFDEYEHGGLPWEVPGKYAEFSPHKKAANLGKYKTPMLIIHNDLDFRCPIGQGHELFTALQRQGVKSRFINFPDEGHWVLKPKNSEHWHKEVFAWLKQHVEPGGK